MNERPLRILHLTAGSDAGGLSQYIYNISLAMHERGHTVAVAGERGAWHWLFEKAPFPWIDLPLKGSPIALWRASHMLRRWLDANNVDVLHTHYRRATLVARRVQKQFTLPILYTVHLSDLSLNWPRRMFSDFGDHTHVASTEARRWCIEDAHVPEQNVTLIHHGIDVNKFPLADDATRLAARQKFNLPSDALVAGFVGRLDDPKNEDWLLDLAARVTNLHLLMAAEGPHEPQVRAKISRLRLSARVHLLGTTNPLPVYRASDVTLLPSWREGFSLVTAESMSVGTPVLRTRTAGASDLILENHTGRITPIDHDAFIAAAINMLTRPVSDLRAMGQRGSQHVQQNFTFDKQLQATLSLYRRIAKLT